MVRLPSFIPAFAALVASTQAAAIPEANPNPEPYTPPEQYYPSPTTAGEPAAKETGSSTYKLYPSPSTTQTFEPVPTPNHTKATKATPSATKKGKGHKTRSTQPTTESVPQNTAAAAYTPTTSSSAPLSTADGPLCTYDRFGLISPANGSTLIQVQKSEYSDYENTTNMTILYCSSQYYKTSSTDIDILISGPDGVEHGGRILAKNVTPTPGAASAGLYGYLVTVGITPVNGQYATGKQLISVYERYTGYYYPYGYTIKSAEVDFEVIRLPQ